MTRAFGFRLAVGVVTKGRASILLEMLVHLAKQTRQADQIMVCSPSHDDVAGADAIQNVKLMIAPPGTSCQRNRILEACGGFDAVLFLDDDFFPADRYLEAIVEAFQQSADIVVTTGLVLADGARGPGLSQADAIRTLADDHYDGGWPGTIPAWNGYGCNMGVRMSPINSHGLRFDERLPLYGWYEDIDFTRRMAKYGQLVRVMAARGVHLGVKSGRVSGIRLGYSQVANPIYLARKGTYPWSHAMSSIARNMAANLVRSVWPEPYVHRRGRVAGNLLAFFDVIRGRVSPERILDLAG